MLTIEKLIWNAWNIEHIARHDLTPEEVQEIFQGFWIAKPTYGGRFVILGQTAAERGIAAVLEPQENGRYYVVTARTAHKTERTFYKSKLLRRGTDHEENTNV
jgi:uncharacterized protein